MVATEATTTTKPTILDIETLNAISARLVERADQIQQVTLQDLNRDLRMAARACDLLAHLRFELGEIAGKTTDQDTARELRDLLDDAQRV
jgi:hypothetical protein